MIRRFVPAGIALTLALAVPATAGAQAGIYLGGGATVPVSDYKDIAKTGWMAHGGFFVPVGEMGLNVIAGGFYGTNDDDVGTGKSNLYGGSAGLLYRVGDPERPGIYFFGTGGILVNDPDRTPAVDSETAFAYNGGVGVAIPVSTVGLWVSGSYTGTAGADLNTSFFGISAGVTIRFGGN